MIAYLPIFEEGASNVNIMDANWNYRNNYKNFKIGKIYGIKNKKLSFWCSTDCPDLDDLIFYYEVEILELNESFNQNSKVRYASKIKILRKRK